MQRGGRKVYALMFDNILVAPYNEATKKFTLVKGVPDFFIPQDLFMKRQEVTIYEVDLWLQERVFPPERIGAKKLLKSLGLKKYDAMEITKKTRACLMEDGWWFAIYPTDTFRNNTIKGASGHPEWDSTTYTLKE